MVKPISIIIPNRNGGAFIGKCLEAVFSTRYGRYEVIVVDDCSEDDSVEIIGKFPCRLIRLEKHSGASKARNTGAFHSTGQILFFTDADCLVREDTLSAVAAAIAGYGPDAVIGGTYTVEPYDRGFFSRFQSLFIHYSEAKNAGNPDYVAGHAMAIDAETFRRSRGFPEDFLPLIEDVEFSHRLRKNGCRLVVDPRIQVRHIFNFSLLRSLQNAFKKSLYWTEYSLKNRDLLADSGAASTELKVNVLSYVLCLALFSAWVVSGNVLVLSAVLPAGGLNLLMSRRLRRAFFEAHGMLFGCLASAYYTLVYPLPVGAGALVGMLRYFRDKRLHSRSPRGAGRVRGKP